MACQVASDDAPVPKVVYENEPQEEALPDENQAIDTPLGQVQDAGIQQAEANADSDKKKLEEIEARNNSDSIVHSTEKILKEH